MSKTFKVGQRVVRKNTVEDYNEYEGKDAILRGTVSSLMEDQDKVVVKWASSWPRDPEQVSIGSLMLEDEANEKFSKLEAEYEAWAGPIRDKMKQAAALLDEANDMATAEGRELHDMHEIARPLFKVMNNMGWNTSSLVC